MECHLDWDGDPFNALKSNIFRVRAGGNGPSGWGVKAFSFTTSTRRHQPLKDSFTDTSQPATKSPVLPSTSTAYTEHPSCTASDSGSFVWRLVARLNGTGLYMDIQNFVDRTGGFIDFANDGQIGLSDWFALHAYVYTPTVIRKRGLLLVLLVRHSFGCGWGSVPPLFLQVRS